MRTNGSHEYPKLKLHRGTMSQLVWQIREPTLVQTVWQIRVICRLNLDASILGGPEEPGMRHGGPGNPRNGRFRSRSRGKRVRTTLGQQTGSPVRKIRARPESEVPPIGHAGFCNCAVCNKTNHLDPVFSFRGSALVRIFKSVIIES